MKFTARIEADTAELHDYPTDAIADMLEKLAGRIRVGGLTRPSDSGPMLDGNGNTVGRWRWQDDVHAANDPLTAADIVGQIVTELERVFPTADEDFGLSVGGQHTVTLGEMRAALS